MTTSGRHLRTTAGIVVVVLASLFTACGSSSKPAATGGTAAGHKTKVSITLTPDGCTPEPSTVAAGEVEFDVENKNADAVAEAELRTPDASRILGERESLTPGLSGDFTVNLRPGSYKITCAGAKRSSWDLRVMAR